MDSRAHLPLTREGVVEGPQDIPRLIDEMDEHPRLIPLLERCQKAEFEFDQAGLRVAQSEAGRRHQNHSHWLGRGLASG